MQRRGIRLAKVRGLEVQIGGRPDATNPTVVLGQIMLS